MNAAPTEQSRDQFPAVVDWQIGEATVQTVDARDLHAFLEVGKDFSTWIKSRIETYGFVESVDYVTFEAAPQNGGAGNRGLRREYALSLDMGKELGMVENNDRGREVRRYFLACERKAKAGITADDLLSNPKQLLAITQGYALEIEDLRREVSTLKPEVAAFERIAKTDGTLGVRETAKALQMPEQKFIAWLQQDRWCYRQVGSRTLLGYADRMKAGLLTHKVGAYQKPDGSEGIRETVRFTAEGLARLAKALNAVIVDGDLFSATAELHAAGIVLVGRRLPARRGGHSAGTTTDGRVEE